MTILFLISCKIEPYKGKITFQTESESNEFRYSIKNYTDAIFRDGLVFFGRRFARTGIIESEKSGVLDERNLLSFEQVRKEYGSYIKLFKILGDRSPQASPYNSLFVKSGVILFEPMFHNGKYAERVWIIK
jgi:hypothetical protein